MGEVVRMIQCCSEKLEIWNRSTLGNAHPQLNIARNRFKKLQEA